MLDRSIVHAVATRRPSFLSFSFSSSPSISYGDRAFSRSPRHPSSSSPVLFSPDASPSERLLSAPPSSHSIQTPEEPRYSRDNQKAPRIRRNFWNSRRCIVFSPLSATKTWQRWNCSLSLSFLLPSSLFLLLPATTLRAPFSFLPSFSSSSRLSSIFLFSMPRAVLSSK